MICPHCATNNKDGNAFCTECGWKLIRPVEPAMEKTPEAPKLTLESPWKEKEQTWQQESPAYESTIVSNGDEPVRKIGFKESVVNFFKNYVQFKGRATRSEYWYIVLLCFLVSLVISIIGNAAGDAFERTANTIWDLAILLPSLSLAWRRMHDIGKSGLFNLLLLIPLVGWIICIVMYCKASDLDNEYGPRKTERNR